MSDNPNYKVLKGRFSDVLKKSHSINYDNLLDCIKKANDIGFCCSHFIRSYLLYIFGNNKSAKKIEDIKDMPILDVNFISMAFKALSKKKLQGQRPNENNLKIYDKMAEYFKNHFVKLIPNYKETVDIEEYKYDSNNLSNILKSLTTQMITSYTNNIKLNFLKYLRQYVNGIFIKTEFKRVPYEERKNYTKVQKIEYDEQLEIEKERIKLIKKELDSVKNDLIEGTLDSDKKYHKWIKNIQNTILPKLDKNLKTHTDGVKNEPFKYLNCMFVMNNELELLGIKSFQPISLRSSVTDNYVMIDSSVIKEIFKEVHSEKTNETLWNEYFKINFRNYKIKDYSFNHMISTDGYSMSIYFIKNSEIQKSVNKKNALAKGRKFGRLLSIEEKIIKAEKEKQNALDLYNKNKEIKRQMKEDFKKLSKEDQKRIRLEIKNKKNKFEYIEDAVENGGEIYERLKKAHNEGKLKFVDLGKIDLGTFLGLGKKTNRCKVRGRRTKGIIKNKDKLMLFSYSNRRRLHETKRLKIGKLIENKKKGKFLNYTKTIKELEAELSNFNKKSMNVSKFNEYVKLKLQLKEMINKEKKYNEYLKKLRFHGHINKQRHEDLILNELEKIYGKDAIFIVGDWSNKGRLNFISTPNLRIKKLLEERFEVYLINEYNTSKLFHKTEKKGDNLQIPIEYEKDGIKKVAHKKIHSVLTFKTSKGRIECINRDYNATLNMMNIMAYLMKHKKRPEKFTHKSSCSPQDFKPKSKKVSKQVAELKMENLEEVHK